MYSHMTHLHSHKHTCTFPLSLANNPTQGKSAHELHGQACDIDSPLCNPRDQHLGMPSEFHCISDSKPHNRHSPSFPPHFTDYSQVGQGVLGGLPHPSGRWDPVEKVTNQYLVTGPSVI